ncbi:hypothetical protein B0H11DRAFT_796627 [Mycena galericulata]|nr:hypothetical protein B0H11DRAFT_796627 [Mycena galericulata]
MESSSTVTALYLTEALLETFLYAVYAVLFAIVVYLFLRRHGLTDSKRPAASTWMLWICLVAQFLTVSGHWITTLYRIYLGSVHLGGGSAADAFYNDLSTPSYVAQVALYGFCVLRSLRIHRLYVVFCYRRIPVIFPLILLVGQAVAGGGMISVFATFDPKVSLIIFFKRSNGWVSTALVFSIVISAYSSAMISRKIWRTRRAVGSLRLSTQVSGGVQPWSFLAIVVESAALQTTASLALLVTFESGNNTDVLWLPISPAIFGISTVLIHARVGLGWAYAGQHDAGGTPSRITFALNTHAHAHADPTKAAGSDGSEGHAAVEAY